MIQDLIIIGAGGFGREVSWLVENINKQKPTWRLLGFADDNPSVAGNVLDGYPVLGNIEWLCTYEQPVNVVCSIANPTIRETIIKRCSSNTNISFATLIDPAATIGKNIEIGLGSIICSGTIVTIDAKIGNHSIVNLTCTIGHDVVLDDFVTIYPTVNISGHVTIGKHAEIGTGTQIIQGLTIGSDTIVGAGSVIIHDIPTRCTAVGVPAKPVKFH